MAEKKVFDVAHPEPAPTVAELKPKKVILTEPPLTDTVATTAPELAQKTDGAPVSRRGITLAPIADVDTPAPVKEETPEQEDSTRQNSLPEEPTTDVTIATAVEPVVELADVQQASDPEPEAAEEDAPEEPKEAESKDTTTFVGDSLGANDAGLDDSQRAAAATKELMQDPKIYDTKTYYVPIGNTRHRHGSAISATLAGLITAAVTIGVAYYIANNL